MEGYSGDAEHIIRECFGYIPGLGSLTYSSHSPFIPPSYPFYLKVIDTV